MKTHTARRDGQKPVTTGSRLRATLEKIHTNSDQIAEGGHPTEVLLRLLSYQRQLGNQALDLGIIMSRQKGASWGTIAHALDLSPQAIEQRMRRLSTRVDAAGISA